MSLRARVRIVCCFYALMIAYAAANAYVTLRTPGGESGWRPNQTDGAVFVGKVSPEGPATALHAGDRLVAINGEPVKDAWQVWRAWQVEPGAAYTVAVERGGERQEYTLRTAPAPPLAWVWLLSVSILTPAIFLTTGLAVFLLKPDDNQALVLALLFGSFLFPFWLGHAGEMPGWLFALVVAGSFAAIWIFPLFLHLFLVFPERSPLLRRFPRAEAWLYLPAALTLLPGHAVQLILLYAHPPGAAEGSLRRVSALLASAGNVLITLYLLGAVVSLVFSYRRASLPARRKLRVVLAGILCSILPAILIALTLPLISDSEAADWAAAVGYLLFPLVPLSFAYAILRHRVIPVSLIVRRGLQYLLARNALRALAVLPAAGLLLTVFANRGRTLDEILFRNSIYFYLLLLAALAFGLVFRRRLSDWIDRKFFREAYDQEKILRALVEDVKRLDSMPEMSRRVSEEVARALHPERAYLFYREREHGDLSLSYTSGGTSHDLRIPDSFQLLRFMELQGGAQDFPLPPKTNLPQAEKDWLASLGARLVVPMTGTDSRLAGLFILGGKKSEVPYTARDRELLESVASQIAIVYENLRLKGRVQEDRKIRQEVLSRFEGQKINLLKECPRCGRCFDSSASVCDADGAELTLTLPVERTVEGRYRLERLIGKGGMGAVYEATHLKLNHKVAVKVLSGQMFGDPSALRRFEREAQALARLSQHPNIVSVHDYGELATEGAFLVMDLIEGESLGALLKRERRVDPVRAAAIFEQVLEGLKAAHAAGIVHRDLKPDNVFLSRSPEGRTQVRLLDFGLAKLTQGLTADSQAPTAREPVTTPGAVMGTFGYMPPEQLTGGRVDERSDLFPVGVMIVEALTGERPFKGKTIHELLTAVLHGEYHLPGDGAGVRRLDDALQHCLAKDPAARFASAAEAQAQLTPALLDYTPHASPADADAATIILRRS